MNTFYGKYGKRLLDFLLATAGLIVLAPLFLILIVWVKLDSPGPVFFKQRRETSCVECCISIFSRSLRWPKCLITAVRFRQHIGFAGK